MEALLCATHIAIIQEVPGGLPAEAGVRGQRPHPGLGHLRGRGQPGGGVERQCRA